MDDTLDSKKGSHLGFLKIGCHPGLYKNESHSVFFCLALGFQI